MKSILYAFFQFVGLKKEFSGTRIALIVGLVVLSVNFYIDEGIRSAIVFIGVPLVPIIKWFLVTKKRVYEDCGVLSTIYINVYDHICAFVVSYPPLLMEKLKMFHQCSIKIGRCGN